MKAFFLSDQIFYSNVLLILSFDRGNSEFYETFFLKTSSNDIAFWAYLFFGNHFRWRMKIPLEWQLYLVGPGYYNCRMSRLCFDGPWNYSRWLASNHPLKSKASIKNQFQSPSIRPTSNNFKITFSVWPFIFIPVIASD